MSAGLQSVPSTTKDDERRCGCSAAAFPRLCWSVRLASYLLEEGGVALLGGSSFGEAGAGYLRLSYATPWRPWSVRSNGSGLALPPVLPLTT